MLMGPGPDTFLGNLALVALLAWPFTLSLILLMVAAVFIGLWKMFEKAGYAGWKCLIPFYNIYIMVDIADLESWYATAFIIQIVILVSTLVLGHVNALGVEKITEIDAYDRIKHILRFPSIIARIVGISIAVNTLYVIYKISRKFQKGLLFISGLIFLPFIFWPIIGLDGSEYKRAMQSNLTSHRD